MTEHLPIKHVFLTCKESLITVFFQLLQNGFRIEGNVGCSVKSFLCEQFGISYEYLEKRIQTIFLDGKPVDDVDAAIVRDGTTLSLSAALPGLAGAVLRRGGYYAPMRNTISCKGEQSPSSMQPGRVFMKLFNLPLRELGPIFLERGIFVEGSNLKEVFLIHKAVFRTECKAARVDGRNIDPDQLLEMDWKTGDIFLQVKTY